MKTVAVIPARYGSTRFPGKPLAKINGVSMIERVYRNVCTSKAIHEVWVATDDKRIEQAVLAFGGNCLMTSDQHQTGTDRIAEAMEKLEADLVINVQGDEPLIQGDVLDLLIQPFLREPELQMATLKTKIKNTEDIENPNVVKVITDRNGNAIYFSRSPIPYNRDGLDVQYYKHIGVYAYRTAFLRQYVGMPRTSLELAESLEQLRAVEHGVRIRVIETDLQLLGVDTPEDIKRVEEYLNKAGEAK